MGPSAEHQSATQETMFEDPTGYAELEAYESYDAPDDPAYESDGGLPEDSPEPASSEFVPEPASGSAATGHAAPPVPSGEVRPELASESAGESLRESVTPESPSAAASNHTAATETESMTVLTVDDFTALEERILRAVDLVRRERLARVAAEERAAALEVEVQAQIPAVERLQREVDSLRAEREQVRQRVERLLGQLDAMEL
jgi:FtsZ-binding cell division protein ZapB